MEDMLDKIENVIKKFIEDFEKNPIKNSLKLLVVYLILRFFYREFKGGRK